MVIKNMIEGMTHQDKLQLYTGVVGIADVPVLHVCNTPYTAFQALTSEQAHLPLAPLGCPDKYSGI